MTIFFWISVVLNVVFAVLVIFLFLTLVAYSQRILRLRKTVRKLKAMWNELIEAIENAAEEQIPESLRQKPRIHFSRKRTKKKG